MRLLIFFWLVISLACVHGSESRVTLLRTPDGGIQPRVAVDASGVVHLVYFKGDPKVGDLFYVRAKAAAQPQWSGPVRVNAKSGSAIAMGTIRGAQIAIGKNNRVHVVWNGSDNAPKGPGGSPMFYTRINEAGTAFEPERNMITWAGGIDGGGSLAADALGNVFVAWHALAGAKGEAERAVFLAQSLDDGKTFQRERKISMQRTGACGCCGLGAIANGTGDVFVLYRAAENGLNRDMTLLFSRDHGGSFSSTKIDPWKAGICPMSSQAFAAGASVYTGWETNGQVFFGKTDQGKITQPTAAPGAGGKRKHPALAINAAGEILFAWSEGTGWNRGGAVAWQIYNQEGRALQAAGRASGLPAWSLIAAFALPDGNFAVVF